VVSVHGTHLLEQAHGDRQSPTADAAPSDSKPAGSISSALDSRRGATPVTLKAKKQAARVAAKARRAGAHAALAASAPQRLVAHFDGAALTVPEGAVVSFYWPFGDELDPRHLARHLGARGHPLSLPVVARPGRPLIFRRWRPGDELTAGPYGIPAPLATAAAVDPDLLLVPLLAFDAAGYRLGYGAGYYDRSLARLRALKAAVAVGIAYTAQRQPAVPHGPEDERLDWIVTEEGARRFGEPAVDRKGN